MQKKAIDKPKTMSNNCLPYGGPGKMPKGVRTGNSYGNRPAVRKLGKK